MREHISFMLVGKKSVYMQFHIVYNRFFSSMKHQMFVNFHFGGIGLFTLKTHTAKWLFVFVCPCHVSIQSVFHDCFLGRHVMTQLTLGPFAFKHTENMLVYIILSVLLECAFIAEKLKCTIWMCTLQQFFSV